MFPHGATADMQGETVKVHVTCFEVELYLTKKIEEQNYSSIYVHSAMNVVYYSKEQLRK